MKTPGKGARKKKKVSGREIEQIVRGIGTVSAPDVSKYIGEDGFIHAVAESVRFRNTVNGYSVLTVNISGEAVTAVGIMPEIEEGDSLAFVGRPETDPRYGFQIRVTDYRAELPDSGSDIERYLASGVIKGVGPKTARRIVEEFGEDTVGVIERHHEWLAKIPGITRTRAEEIHEQFMRTADIRTVMAAFRDSFGPSLTMRIFAKFGTGAVRILEEDPFRLADEIDGISFEKIDALAAEKGMDPLAPGRISSGVRYMLARLTWREGNTCVRFDTLIERSAAVLGCPKKAVSDAVGSLVSGGVLKVVRDSETEARVYDKTMYDDELYIATRLCSLCRESDPLSLSDIESFIDISEAEKGIVYDDGQKQAIFTALSRGVMILTGGPGTGKTTVINALTGIFARLNMKTALAAPTGRAAKRMTESTGTEAKTVHRLLEVDYQGDGVRGAEDRPDFRRNESCPLDEEVIIVDECSMLDTSLTASLLRAMRRGSRLILIGDSDQLPSVGPGNVLHDVISSGALPVISLEKVWRQAEMSLIVSNAHLINKGKMPVIDVRDRDFFFIRCDSDAQIAATVCDLCNRRLPAAYPDEQVQVISPSKRGDAGADRLNSALRDLINPAARDKPELIRETGSFRKGDKVMQIRNNYGLEWTCGRSSGTGVFNGDIGFITDADPVEGSVSVDFDGRRASYTKTDLTDLDQAYAITVHKSQGSEYPTVVIPIGNVPPFLRTRNLIYTAVTRAINRVIIVGRQDVLAEMVATPDSGVRMTGLSQMLAASGRKN